MGWNEDEQLAVGGGARGEPQGPGLAALPSDSPGPAECLSDLALCCLPGERTFLGSMLISLENPSRGRNLQYMFGKGFSHIPTSPHAGLCSPKIHACSGD